MASPLSSKIGRGGGTNIASDLVAHAAADGYTLLSAVTAAAINATLYDKLNFNFLRDIAPIAGIIRTPLALLVNTSFPARTVPEFVAYAKANPGKIIFASPGTGTASQVGGELFKMLTGVDMLHVPYRGDAPAHIDLLAGRVQSMFANLPSSSAHIAAGKVRALAVTTATRWEGLPDLPTVAEFVSGFEASFWIGLAAPRNTPADIVDRLNKEINAALDDPAMKSRFFELGGAPLAGSPASFEKLVADETEKWGKVVKLAGLKPE